MFHFQFQFDWLTRLTQSLAWEFPCDKCSNSNDLRPYQIDCCFSATQSKFWVSRSTRKKEKTWILLKSNCMQDTWLYKNTSCKMKLTGKVHKESSSNVQPYRKGARKEQSHHETYRKGEQERCIKISCNMKHTGKVQQETVCIVSNLCPMEPCALCPAFFVVGDCDLDDNFGGKLISSLF